MFMNKKFVLSLTLACYHCNTNRFRALAASLTVTDVTVAFRVSAIVCHPLVAAGVRPSTKKYSSSTCRLLPKTWDVLDSETSALRHHDAVAILL